MAVFFFDSVIVDTENEKKNLARVETESAAISSAGATIYSDR